LKSFWFIPNKQYNPKMKQLRESITVMQLCPKPYKI